MICCVIFLYFTAVEGFVNGPQTIQKLHRMTENRFFPFFSNHPRIPSRLMYQNEDLESVIPPDWRQFRARLVADEKWREVSSSNLISNPCQGGGVFNLHPNSKQFLTSNPQDQTKAMAKSSFKRFFLPPAADDGYPAAKETGHE